jgi:hypothetical protein
MRTHERALGKAAGVANDCDCRERLLRPEKLKFIQRTEFACESAAAKAGVRQTHPYEAIGQIHQQFNKNCRQDSY